MSIYNGIARLDVAWCDRRHKRGDGWLCAGSFFREDPFDNAIDVHSARDESAVLSACVGLNVDMAPRRSRESREGRLPQVRACDPLDSGGVGSAEPLQEIGGRVARARQLHE
jgi:hypothetical protein